MKKILLILFGLIGYSAVNAQHIGVFPGVEAEKTFIEVSVPGHWFSGKHAFSRRYEFFISFPIGKNFSILGTHSRYYGWTSFSLDRPGSDDNEVESGFAGHGSSRARVRRTGIALSKQILNFRNIARFSSYVDCRYERSLNSSKRRDRRSSEVNWFQPEYDVSNFTDWTVSVEVIPGTQIVPGFGFRADFRLFWRIYGHLQYGWTYGNRTYQKLYFEHDYLGEPAPTGVWYSNGTIRYKSWGLSVKFAGKKDEYDKDKLDWF